MSHEISQSDVRNFFKYIIKGFNKKEDNKNRMKFRSSFIWVKFSRLQTPTTISEKNWGLLHFFSTFLGSKACQVFIHLLIFHLMHYVETAGLVYSFKIWNFFFQMKASWGSCAEIFLSQVDIRRIVVINNSACRF